MDESLNLPDFTAPDFTQPTLQPGDLMQPNFFAPNPNVPESAIAASLAHLPDASALFDSFAQLAPNRPDPFLPDLTEPEVPASLTQPAPDEHVMPEPAYQPEVVMTQRPGELAPNALQTMLVSPDHEELPTGLSYPELYTTQDEMTLRKRHLGRLELGLEGER